MNGFSILSDTICYVFFQGGGRKKEPAWWNFLIFCFSYVVVLVCFRGCFYVFCPPISHHIAYFRVHSLAKSVYFSWKINKNVFGQKKPFIQCRIIFAQSSRQVNIIVFLKDKIKHTYSVSFEYSCNFRYQWIIRIWITK